MIGTHLSIRHEDHAFVSSGSAHMGKTYTGVACSTLYYGAARAQATRTNILSYAQ